jgi:hypothetical protein
VDSTSTTVYSSDGVRTIVEPGVAFLLGIDPYSNSEKRFREGHLRHCGHAKAFTCGCLSGMGLDELKSIPDLAKLHPDDLGQLLQFLRDEADAGEFHTIDSLKMVPYLANYIADLWLNRELSLLSAYDDDV